MESQRPMPKCQVSYGTSLSVSPNYLLDVPTAPNEPPPSPQCPPSLSRSPERQALESVMRLRSLCNVASALRGSTTVPLHSTRVPPKITDAAVPPLPPVVMIHGLLASESTYRSIVKRPDLAPRREVIGVDLRNHGRSPHVPAEAGMRYEDMASDLAALLDAEGIDKACLVGHSMGGKVAMQLALSEPERVSELVVVDIAPITYTPTSDPGDPFTTTKAMRAVNLRNVQTREQVDAALLVGGVGSETVRQFAMTNLALSSSPGVRYEWKVNVDGILAAFPGVLGFPDQAERTFQGPTCVIRGGKSKYVPFQAMKAFTALFPNTKLVTISEAGHWLQSQCPDDFTRALNDFLGD